MIKLEALCGSHTFSGCELTYDTSEECCQSNAQAPQIDYAAAASANDDYPF